MFSNMLVFSIARIQSLSFQDSYVRGDRHSERLVVVVVATSWHPAWWGGCCASGRGQSGIKVVADFRVMRDVSPVVT
jgi:hypothetical protein